MATKIEEFKKMIAEMKELLKQKDEKTSEYKELVEKLSKEFEEKYAELKKEMEEKLAYQRKAPIDTGGNVSYDIKSLINQPAFSDEVKRIHKVYDYLMLVHDLVGPHAVPKAIDALQYEYPSEIAILKDAMSGGASGGGAEFVPVGYSRTLFEELLLDLRVAALHQRIEMPTKVFHFPIAAQDSQAYLVTETTNDTSGDATIPSTTRTTGEFVLTAKTLATRTRFTDDLNEDTIVPLLPFIRNSLRTAIAKGIENAIINGDTAGSLDADIGANDPRLAFDGYRKLAIAAAKKDAGGTLEAEDLIGVRQAMGKYGIYPNALAWVVSPQIYLGKLMNLKDSGGNNVLLTVEKYGPNATIVTGEVGKIFGIPVIVSEFVREDLNTSGVYDGTTTTTSEIILVHRDSFVMGYRRDLKIETGRLVERQQNTVVASVRVAFGTPWSDKPVVGILYNITV